MPGIRTRTAARILIDVGDGSGFATSSHLAAYAGLAAATRSSGSTIRGEHPCRRGSKLLKRAFYLAAFASLSQPESRAYYDRKRREGKHHVAALIALARRHIDVLFTMLRDGTFYQPPTPATQRLGEHRRGTFSRAGAAMAAWFRTKLTRRYLAPDTRPFWRTSHISPDCCS